MNTEGYEKTNRRQSKDEVSTGADPAEKPQEFGGFSSPGDEPVAELIMDAEDPRDRGPGAPKKPARARKDALRAYAAQLGAEPGELLLATVLQGLQEYLDKGGELGHWMEMRSKRMAKSLRIPRGEAFKLIHKMISDAMPYVHQKLPQLIEMPGAQVMVAFVAPDGAVQGTPASGPGGLDMRPANVRQIASNNDKNQPKSDDDSRTQDEDDQQ